MAARLRLRSAQTRSTHRQLTLGKTGSGLGQKSGLGHRWSSRSGIDSGALAGSRARLIDGHVEPSRRLGGSRRAGPDSLANPGSTLWNLGYRAQPGRRIWK